MKKIRPLLLLLTVLMCVTSQAAISDIPTNWNPINQGVYENSMIIFAEVHKNGVPFIDESGNDQLSYELGVFGGDECRVVVRSKKDNNNRVYFSITAPGYDQTVGLGADTLRFFIRKIGETNAEKYIRLNQKVIFKSNDLIENFILTVNIPISTTPQPDGVIKIYVSPIGSSNGASETAPADLEQAMNALAGLPPTAEKVIECNSGTYYFSRPIQLINGLTIRKNVNSSADVIFDARSTTRHFEVTSIRKFISPRPTLMRSTADEAVVFDGIVFKNGNAESLRDPNNAQLIDNGNGGALLLRTIDIVRNCEFYNNTSAAMGGAVYGGIIENSLFVASRSTSGGDAFANSQASYCTVVRGKGTISAVMNSTLANSVVWGNSTNVIDNSSTISSSAIQGKQYKGCVNLHSINDADQYDATATVLTAIGPRFASVALGAEDWHLNNYSPMNKTALNGTDMGYSQSSFPKLLIAGVQMPNPNVMYGSIPDVQASFTDALGNSISGITNFTLYYTAKDGTDWSTTIPKNVGFYWAKITVNQVNGYETDPSRNSNPLEFNVYRRPIVIRAANKVQYYGEQELPLTYTSEGENDIREGDSPTGSMIRSENTNVNAKEYVISQGSLSFGENYEVTFHNGTYAILPRPIIIEAHNKEKVYGYLDPPLTASVRLKTIEGATLTGNAVLDSDPMAGDLAREANENTNAAGYPITQGTFAPSSSNYAIEFIPAKFVIKKREIQITANIVTSQIYGDVPTRIDYNITSGTLLEGHQFSGTLSRENETANDAASYPVTLGNLIVLNQQNNYHLVLINNGASYNITKRKLSVTAEGKSFTYGDQHPALTYITSGQLASWDTFAGELDVDSWDAGDRRILQNTLTVHNINSGKPAISNYDFLFNGATMKILKRPLTITAQAVTKVYGEPTPPMPALTSHIIRSGSLASGDIFSGEFVRNTVNETAQLYTGDIVIKPNIPLITNNDAADRMSNYELVYIPANFEITKRPLSIKALPYNRYYGEPEGTIGYDIIEGTTLASGETLELSLTRENASSMNVGRYAIVTQSVKIMGSGESKLANYNLTSNSDFYIIHKRPIIITPKPVAKSYMDASPAIEYAYALAQNQPYLLTGVPLVNTDAFVGSLTRENNENVGRYVISMGSLTVTGNYDLQLDTEPQYFVIEPRVVKIKPSATTQIYGESPVDIAYTNTNLGGNDQLTGKLSRSEASFNVNAGIFDITMGDLRPATNASNYQLVFDNPGNLNRYTISRRSITVNAIVASATYGDPVFKFSHTTNGSLAAWDMFDGALDVDNWDAGLHNIVQSDFSIVNRNTNESTIANYDFTYNGATLNVLPRQLTFTAQHVSKMYGDPTPSMNASTSIILKASSLVAGDYFSGDFIRSSSEEDARLFLNDIVINPNKPLITGDDGTDRTGNYSLIYTPANFEIAPRPLTVRAKPFHRYYGELEGDISYEVVDGTTLATGETLSLIFTRESVSSSNVGQYTMKVKSVDIINNGVSKLSNYKFTPIVDYYNIHPRPIVVTPSVLSKIYMDTEPLLSYDYAVASEPLYPLTSSIQLVGNDKFVGSLTRESGEDANRYKIMLGSLQVSDNYDIQLNPQTTYFTVVQKDIIIAPHATTQVYGEPFVDIPYSATKVPGSDYLLGKLSRQEVNTNNNVGAYIINLGDLRLSSNGSNYNLILDNANNEIKYTITPRPIIIASDNIEMMYGAPQPPFTFMVHAGTLAFNDSFTGEFQQDNPHVGAHSIGLGTFGISDNYDITYRPGMFVIAPRPITIKITDKTKVYGENTPNFDFKVISSTQLAANDVVKALVIRANEAETAASYANELEFSDFSIHNPLIGSVTSDYDVSIVKGNYSITKRPVAIFIDDQEKLVDAPDPQFTYTIGGMGFAPNENFISAIRRERGEDVGYYSIYADITSLASNYLITDYTKGTLTIDKSIALIETSDLSHVFDRKPKQGVILTQPRGLNYTVTYNGESSLPVNIGVYEMIVTIQERNYRGEAILKFEITEPSVKRIAATRAISKSSGRDMTFRMMYEELMTDTRLQIFNSRGTVIFDQYNYRSGDCSLANKPAGTYYYVFTYKDQEGRKQIQKDFIEVLP